MQAEISKDFDFSASHRLEDLPKNHQCSRIHGHNYRIRVTITGQVVSPGFVVDYSELSFFKTWIDDKLDHRHMNDVMESNPTAENMAALMVEKVVSHLSEHGYDNVSAVKVSVSETPKTWATVMCSISAKS